MTIRHELQRALESWTSNGCEAFELAEELFADVAGVIRKRFPNVTLAEIELLLADLRRDTEDDLLVLMTNTIDRDTAVDIVAQRFFGED